MLNFQWRSPRSLFLAIILVSTTAHSQFTNIYQSLQTMKEYAASAAVSASAFLEDYFYFDSAAINKHREALLVEIRQRQANRLAIINNPDSPPEHVHRMKVEEQRINGNEDCLNTAGQIRSELLQNVASNCRVTEIVQTCEAATEEALSALNNALNGAGGALRKAESARRDGIRTELTTVRDQTYSTLKNTIAPANTRCYEIYKGSISDNPTCLNTYLQVLTPSRQQELASNCNEQTINNLFDQYINFMSSTQSPFYPVAMIQEKRKQAREAEFKIAKILIMIDDVITQWEQMGRAPAAPLISPRPQARPSEVQ